MSLKKILYVFICLLLVPSLVFAKEYKLDENVTITMDDTEWYVFTRDNINGNPELEELGISYEYLNKFFEDNKVYMDAVLYFEGFEDYIEVFVRKNPSTGTDNLSDKDDSYVLQLAESMASMQEAEIYKVFKTDYKYGRLQYMDLGLYLDEFFTIYDGYAYTMTFQSTREYTSQDTARIEQIMKSIKFAEKEKTTKKNNNSDSSIIEEDDNKEKTTKKNDNSDSSIIEEDDNKEKEEDSIVDSAIRGAIIGGVAGGVGALVAVSMKKKKETDSTNVGQ